MKKVMQFIRPTNIVRQIMYKHGRDPYCVWTNNYEHCRTVKCYSAGQARDDNMLEEILDVLQELQIKFQIRFTSGSMFRPGAVIIRLPK